MTNDWTEEVIAEKLAKGEITIHPDSTYKPFGDAQDKPPMPPNRGKGQTLPSDPTPDTPSTEIQRKTRTTPERDFQNQIIDLARFSRWRVAHFRPAMKKDGTWVTPVSADGKGFPDLCLVRHGVLIFFECKVGKVRAIPAEQITWLDLLSEVSGVIAKVVRPSDWDEIVKVLTEG